MRLRVFALVVLAIAGWNCKKSDSSGPVNPPPANSDYVAIENSRLSAAVTTVTANAFVSGMVTDEEGKGLPDVSITAGDSSVKTDSKGFFQFHHSVKLNRDYAVLTAVLDGYFKSIKTFTPGSSGKAAEYVELKLLKQGTAKTMSSAGGNVVLDNSVDLTFPASALATSNGTAYTGDYKVSARYIDPSAPDFFETMPGLLAGLNDQNQLRALRSLGMAVVEITDNAGNKLQIAPGKKVTMKLPAGTGGPATVPLWHFSEKYGIWIQAGSAARNGNVYTAEVDHFSTWNLDLDVNSYKLTVQFKNAGGNNLAGLKVQAYTGSEYKIVSFITDDQGMAELINCPASEPLIFKTVFTCDTLVTQLLPLTADRSEIITLQPDPAKIVTFSVSGKITGCDGTFLPDQPFQLYVRNGDVVKGIPGVTDAQGNYSLAATFCNAGSTATVQALAFLDPDYRYAPSATLNTGNTTYDARICDSTTTISDNFVVTFPDSALDAVIRMKIGKPSGSILYGEVKNIDSLDNGSMIIHDITGLQYCANLRSLRIGYADLADISPLRTLTQLTGLELISVNGKGLSDLSPLEGLVNLSYFQLNSDEITNITPLKNMTALTFLGLYSNGLTDISSLSGMTKLESLYLSGSQLSDITVLKNLVKLNNLDIHETKISDITTLQSLINLTWLSLSHNNIVDVAPLANLTKIYQLIIANNKIEDISPLQNMTGLDYLFADSNRIATLPVMNNMTSLYLLSLNGNLVKDVSALQNVASLQMLFVNSNDITNIAPLINGVPLLSAFEIQNQASGPLSPSQKTGFMTTHPKALVKWD